MRELTRKDISQITGLSKACVQGYTDIGLVIPGIENPKGKGGTRIYSEYNLRHFKIIKELRGFLPLSSIAEILKKDCNELFIVYQRGAMKIYLDMSKI